MSNYDHNAEAIALAAKRANELILRMAAEAALRPPRIAGGAPSMSSALILDKPYEIGYVRRVIQSGGTISAPVIFEQPNIDKKKQKPSFTKSL